MEINYFRRFFGGGEGMGGDAAYHGSFILGDVCLFFLFFFLCEGFLVCLRHSRRGRLVPIAMLLGGAALGRVCTVIRLIL